MLYLDYSRSQGQWRPNVHGGRENLDAIAFLQEVNATAYRRLPGIIMIAEESTAWPGVTTATSGGGLGFGFKWNMGWMNDTLRYLAEEPINRRYHHNEIDLLDGLRVLRAASSCRISHDEVVHGKGSLVHKMPGDTLAAGRGPARLLTYQWAHPGKQLLFMGCEFGQDLGVERVPQPRLAPPGVPDPPGHRTARGRPQPALPVRARAVGTGPRRRPGSSGSTPRTPATT